MSAFIVGNHTLNNAVTAFKEAHPNGFVLDGKPLDDNALGKALYRMNVAAVNQRYSNHEPESASIRFKYKPEVVNSIQLAKSVYCLKYQCNEGDVPEWPLYQELEKIAEALNPPLVANSSVWRDVAKWDY